MAIIWGDGKNFMAIRRGKSRSSDRFSWAPKSLEMVITAMKLKDTCSLEDTLWPTSVQFSCSIVSDSLRPHGLHQLPELTQTHVHQVSDAIQTSHPLLSPSSPALNLSTIRVFSNESVLCIRWPKYWSFSFSISPSNEYSGLISFQIDWFDLLATKGLSRVFSNTTVQKHQFFNVQFSI